MQWVLITKKKDILSRDGWTEVWVSAKCLVEARFTDAWVAFWDKMNISMMQTPRMELGNLMQGQSEALTLDWSHDQLAELQELLPGFTFEILGEAP